MLFIVKIFFLIFLSSLSYSKEVNFHAWGGSNSINKYIQNFSEEILKDHQIRLNHIKIDDTQTSVNLILSEGDQKKSKVDLIWINGENFSKLYNQDLLYGPIISLENLKYLDLEDPTLITDFGLATNMYEIPWGRSQLVFLYDSEIINDPFYDIESFKSFLISNKGRFTYPKIPNFHGTTFLKQIMYELGHQDIMKEKYNNLDQSHKNAIQDLISFLNEYHPYMWSGGKRFPKNNTTMMQMLTNRELFISLSFNPNEASSQIAQNNLRESTKTFTFQNGSIANTHFLAIPKYSKNIDHSLLIINKLISPKYQSLKLNNDIWGDPTVLDFTKLSMEDKNLFLYKNFENNLKNDVPKKTEPHNSWTEVIEKNWIEIFN